MNENKVQFSKVYVITKFSASMIFKLKSYIKNNNLMIFNQVFFDDFHSMLQSSLSNLIPICDGTAGQIMASETRCLMQSVFMPFYSWEHVIETNSSAKIEDRLMFEVPMFEGVEVSLFQVVEVPTNRNDYTLPLLFPYKMRLNPGYQRVILGTK